MQRRALGAAVVAAVLVGLVLLRPVLLAPVTGDDVYYALGASADADSTLTDVVELPGEWSRRVAKGRVNVLTAVERRITGRVMVNTAVATGRPPHQILAGFRVGYATLSLFAVYALLRSIRWRRRDSGDLVRIGSRIRVTAMVAGGLAFAVGAQPQLVGAHGLNGWLSYPVSTWTAAFSIFGVVALALWLARLTTVRGWGFGAAVAFLFAGIGALTNFRYELTFPAVPLTLIALSVVPVSDRRHRTIGRRAKLLVGGAYVVGFVPVLLLNRMMLSDTCRLGQCYEGVNVSLRPAIVQVFANNVISSIPGTGRREILRLLRAESVPATGAWVPTPWSLLIALALLATLALAWRGTGRHRTERPADPDESRAQAIMCLVAAALLTLGGLGAAAVMSLSQRAQEDMSEIGILFRHSVVTWTAAAFAVVLLVLAVGLVRPRLATPSFLVLGLVMALLAATKLPADGRTMVANAARMRPTMHVFHEVVQGDTSDLGNQRRCRILRTVDREMSAFYARKVRRTSQRAFERHWEVPFCDPA